MTQKDSIIILLTRGYSYAEIKGLGFVMPNIYYASSCYKKAIKKIEELKNPIK